MFPYVLPEEVQEYYEHLESLLASHIKIRSQHDERSIDLAEFEYFKSVVKERFAEFSNKIKS